MKRKKQCLVFETLGSVQNMQVQEGKAADGLMRLTGVFGVTGIKNENQRIYSKDNYGLMVENMQKEILSNGVMGELEHPNSFNINLNNVSHKIESIKMNEDGTITGTIALLNTEKGKNAQAIVEAGLPLYISSRGAGSITNEGKVTLSALKTYDLVGTPGFNQAKFTLKHGQALECLNEGYDPEHPEKLGTSPQTWVVIESEDDDQEPDDADNKADNAGTLGKDDKADKADKDDKADKADKEGDDDKDNQDPDSDDEGDDDKDKNKENQISMEDLKKSIDSLKDQIKSLEAELHVAKESKVNYDAIEKWVTEEFGKDFKKTILAECSQKIDESTEKIAEGVQKWALEEFAPEVQNWVVEEFAPEVQNWVVEEFSPEVQNWVVEQFAPEVQNWVVEEFAPEVQNWITEEYSPALQNWITEEYSPEIENWITEEYSPTLEGWITEEFGSDLEGKVNENVSAFLESQKDTRLSSIDSLLETIDQNSTPLQKVISESMETEKFRGIYAVEKMPAQYKPAWELLDESRQNEIVTSSKAYDFTKEGVLESFWSSVDFKTKKPELVNENKEIPQGLSDYHNSILAQAFRLRK